MKRSLFFSASLSVLAAPGLAMADEAAKSSIPERPVSVTTVSTGSVVESVSLVGELQGEEEIRIFALITERIKKLLVDEGSVVKQGEVLAILQGDLQVEGVNQAQAALEAAVANRDAIRESLERVRALAKVGSATQSQLDSLEAQFRAADAQVRQATAGLGSAGAQRDRVYVRSPISGVVAQVQLREGDLAAAGVPIVTVVKPDKLKAVVRVPERSFLRVEKGMKVTVSPLAMPELKVEGTVTVKGPVVDRTTRTGLVEVHLDNSDGQLVAGSAVRVIIELMRREDVVLVPSEAVLLTSETLRTGKAIAFVVDGKTAKLRDVSVGLRQGTDIEVREGLAPGETIVVQGAHLLRDGNPLKITQAKAEQPKATASEGQ